MYYLNGARVGSLRMPAVVNYTTLATNQLNEGLPEILTFPTNNLVNGDNLMAVEVHQVNNASSDDVFGLQLSAVQSTTNLITTTTVGVSVVLNEILARNQSLTNADGTTSDWIELFNTSTNALDLADVSLSNDPNEPRKFVFTPGTSIPAGGFLVIYCNNNLASSTNTQRQRFGGVHLDQQHRLQSQRRQRLGLPFQPSDQRRRSDRRRQLRRADD